MVSTLRWVQVAAWVSAITFVVAGTFLAVLGRVQSQRSGPLAVQKETIGLRSDARDWPNETQVVVLTCLTLAAWVFVIVATLSTLGWVQIAAWTTAIAFLDSSIVFLLLLLVLEQRRLGVDSVAQQPESAQKTHRPRSARSGSKLWVWGLFNLLLVSVYWGFMSDATWVKMVSNLIVFVMACVCIAYGLKNTSFVNGSTSADRGTESPTPTASAETSGS